MFKSISFRHDGEFIPQSIFENLVDRRLIRHEDVFSSTRRDGVTVNCVGFMVNEDRDLLIIFPKHYRIDGTPTLEEFAPVFRAINRSSALTRDVSFGPESDPFLETSYPFNAFFEVLTYYNRYGLHFDEVWVDSKDRGKANWKKTIDNADYFLADGRLSFFPVRRESSLRSSNLVTDAMVYVINHTVALFGSLLGAGYIPFKSSIRDATNSYEAISAQLRQIRAATFNDRYLGLLDSLIAFFSSQDPGSGYFFKTRNFAYVWEMAVGEFFQRRFELVDEGGNPRFAAQIGVRQVYAGERFKKLKVANINSESADQSITIDHYWLDSVTNTQYVFDSKYYLDLKDLNYKQIFYTLLQSLDPKLQGVSIVSALLLPSEGFRAQTHFSLDPRFSGQLKSPNPSLGIKAFFLDCREVIESFEEGV